MMAKKSAKRKKKTPGTCAERAIALIDSEPKLVELQKALPEHMDAKRFARLAVTMLRKPELAECSVKSILATVLESAQLGLYLDGVLGHAYIVPFKAWDDKLKKKVKQATLIIGYRGYIYMALRTGFVNDVGASVVYDGDDFDYRKGTDPYLHHKPVRDAAKRGKVTAAYSIITYKTGIRTFEVMEEADLAEIESRALAKGGSFSPWRHRVDKKEMQKKSVARLHLKYAGLSADLTRRAVQDEYYEAGIGRDPKEIEAEEVERDKFKDTMANGQSLEGPKHVDSESEPVTPAKLTAKDRSNLIVDHHRYSMAIGRKRLPMETLEGMSDSALTDAVEILKQQAEEKTNAENHAGDDPGDANPFHD
jgi:recombination protein RecT